MLKGHSSKELFPIDFVKFLPKQIMHCFSLISKLVERLFYPNIFISDAKDLARISRSMPKKFLNHHKFSFLLWPDRKNKKGE